MGWSGPTVGRCAAETPGKRISAAIVERQRADDDDDDDSRAEPDADDLITAERGIAEAVFLCENREYLDWWLMQRFPGRTLEELDGVDWLRLQRAEQVARIVDVEQRHATWLKRKDHKASDLSPADWRMIRRHNRMVGEDG